mgnify:CR=1 FL=1
MTAAHTTVLELLGKQVSFVYTINVSSKVHYLDCSGIITNIVISLNDGPEISIDEGDFYKLSELSDFKLI